MPGINSKAPFTKTSHKGPYDAIDPTKPTMSAVGKTVLITAGHTGIGFAVAQNFAAAASLTDHVKVKETIARIRSNISPDIDILVTSAAYLAPVITAIDLPLDEIKASFDTNYFGNVNLVKEFLAGSWESSGRQKVILDISTLAAHLLIPMIGAYGVSKLAFTQWLARVQQDMADKQLRVHSFHPGNIFTEAVKGFGLTEDTMPWDDVQLPGRFAVWLASENSEFLKGRFVWATWDVQELMERKGDLESDSELLKIGLQGNPAGGL